MEDRACIIIKGLVKILMEERSAFLSVLDNASHVAEPPEKQAGESPRKKERGFLLKIIVPLLDLEKTAAAAGRAG